MDEILRGIGLICATGVGAAAVSFGFLVGVHAATWAFGPITINFKHGDLNVVLNGRDKGSRE